MIMANGSLKERRPVETGPKIIGGKGSIYIHQRELWYVLVGRILLCVIWRSVYSRMVSALGRVALHFADYRG